MALTDYSAIMQSASDSVTGPVNALIQAQANRRAEDRRNALFEQNAQQFQMEQQDAQDKRQQAVREQDLRDRYAEMVAIERAPPQYRAQYVQMQAQRHPEFANTPFAQMPPEQAFEGMKRGIEAQLGIRAEAPAGPIEYQRTPWGGYLGMQDGKKVADWNPPAPQQVGPESFTPQTLEDGSIALVGNRGTIRNTNLRGQTKPGQGGSPQAPIPTAALRIVDEAKQAMAAANDSKTLVNNAVTALMNGKVQLGAVRNLESRTRNYAGISDANSRAYADLRQTLEKLRNNYLLLAKGVQTEGDAQRAWNSEIGESVQNDNALALQQLTKAQGMIDRALSAQQGRIDTVYSNFGATPPQAAPQAQAWPDAPQAAIDALKRDPRLAPQFVKKYGRLPQGFNANGR